MKNLPKIILHRMIAWHGYYIFLKSFRSLEEFRKNHHIKIPPKSPVQISKSFVNSKILFYFRKEFPLAFGPISPAAS
jgi:hypothetical protein